MKKQDLHYVYQLEYKSCKSTDGNPMWIERANNRVELPQTMRLSVYEAAAQIALRSYTVTELGVRVTFLGLIDKSWPNSEPTEMNPFTLTLERK